MDKVARYYDYTLPFYQFFWHGDSYGLHYGYWEDGITSLKAAILNENKVLADRVGITKEDNVLDAGCGVGGSSLWLAAHRGCRVSGITISQRQRARADRLAIAKGLHNKLSFFVRDYFNTGFPGASFSVVWAIESLCHGHDRLNDLAAELFRVLEPGGRLVVADGFLGKERSTLTAEETEQSRIFEEGFVVPPLASAHAFHDALEKAGFVNIHYENATAHILPTAHIMWRRCIRTYPVVRVLERLGLMLPIISRNNKTGVVQRELFEKGTLVYGIFSAERPRN
jgi:cyclopropane fatty-acyl-phospholipid synthase-like methyltransferase